MAAQTRTTLKTYFNTGDTPTETQFANLIDSFHNTTDDGTALTDVTGEAIGSLSDVVVTGTPADNEVLAYDSGGNWINQTAAEAGLAAATHTHVEADITDLGTYLTDITGESVGDLSDVTITTGAQGDILYNNGSAWVNLAPGTSGQYLQTQGAAANPQWATLSGGGDMAAATYDPGNIAANVYDTDNHIDGTVNKVFTAVDEAKLGGIEAGATADLTQTAAIFVSKVGDDGSAGTSPRAAKLTIGSAITAASALISGGATGVRIEIVDGGTYTESISVPTLVTLFGPGATVAGEVSVAGGGEVILDRVVSTANNQNLITLSAATDGAGMAKIATIDGSGHSGVNCVRNIGGGGKNLFVESTLIKVGATGTGIGDVSSGFGHIHFKVADLYLAGNSAVGLKASNSGAGSGTLIGFIDHILEIGTPTSTTGILIDHADASVKLVAAEIIADTAWDITAGSLYLACPKVTGVQTGTPTAITSLDGHTHVEADITDLGTYLTDITGEALDDLSDVVITTVADNEVLAYDSGGNWINQTPAEAGLAEAIHTHTESDITDLGSYMANPMTTAGDLIYGGASGAPTRLAAGTENYVLTMGATNPEWAEAAASGGGVTIYDAEVDGAGGGDYTTVTAALAAGKRKILLTGDTTEPGNVTLTSYTLIESGGTDKYQINLGSNYFVAATVTDLTIRNVEIYSESASVFVSVDFKNTLFEMVDFTTGATVEDKWFTTCTFDGVLFDGCTTISGEKNQFITFTSVVTAPRLVVRNHKHVTTGGNDADDFLVVDTAIDSGYITFQNCFIQAAKACLAAVDSGPNKVISFNDCYIYNTGATALIEAEDCRLNITNGYIYKSGYILEVKADDAIVTLNGVCLNTATGLATGSLAYKSDISLNNCSIDNGFGDVMFATPSERHYSVNIRNCNSTEYDAPQMLQLSERRVEPFEAVGALNGGEVVVLGAHTATERKVVATTTADDTTVMGIVEENRTDGQMIKVCRRGWIPKAKVDGTTDIAIGDYLGTSTAAGIMVKTTTPGARVAIALGAYTTDDANGLIPVLLLERPI